MTLLRRMSLCAGLLLVLTDCQIAQPLPEEFGFHERPCWFFAASAQETRCGWLVVAENRTRSESRKIHLPVVIFPAREQGSEAPPLLYITGGPGGRARIGNRGEIEGWLRRIEWLPPQRDVIVLGLRGTGRTGPDLDCPEMTDPRIWAGAGSDPREREAKERTLIAATVACRDKLRAEGVDLTAYNSREAAADIAELRRSLGIENWSLYGISYGSRIALAVLRDHPQGVSSVVLDSVVPPEASRLLELARFFEAAMNRLFSDCRRSEVCRKAHPDLEAKFDALVTRLAAEPVELSLPSGRFWPSLRITMDQTVLLAVFFEALYRWDLTERLPAAIAQALAGDFAPMKPLAVHYFHQVNPRSFSPPVYLSFRCHEEANFVPTEARLEAIRKAGRFGPLIEDDLDHLLCPHWPAGQADDVEDQRVVSKIPALLLTGSYDPITPPVFARGAAEGLASSHVVEFANVGHGVLGSHPCASEVVAAFFADPVKPPRPACLGEIQPPDFSGREDDPRR